MPDNQRRKLGWDLFREPGTQMGGRKGGPDKSFRSKEDLERDMAISPGWKPGCWENISCRWSEEKQAQTQLLESKAQRFLIFMYKLPRGLWRNTKKDWHHRGRRPERRMQGGASRGNLTLAGSPLWSENLSWEWNFGFNRANSAFHPQKPSISLPRRNALIKVKRNPHLSRTTKGGL